MVECSFEWNAGYSEDVLPFTNNIPQRDSGTHLLGFRSALTRVINKYSNDRNSNKRNKITLSGEDIKEGLTAVIGKNADPKFSSQTKDKLVSSEIRLIVESIITIKFQHGLTRSIYCQDSAWKNYPSCNGTRCSRKARDSVRRKGTFELSILPGKLADCQIQEKVQVT